MNTTGKRTLSESLTTVKELELLTHPNRNVNILVPVLDDNSSCIDIVWCYDEISAGPRSATTRVHKRATHFMR